MRAIRVPRRIGATRLAIAGANRSGVAQARRRHRMSIARELPAIDIDLLLPLREMEREWEAKALPLRPAGRRIGPVARGCAELDGLISASHQLGDGRDDRHRPMP
jgi:hypothetical protein